MIESRRHAKIVEDMQRKRQVIRDANAVDPLETIEANIAQQRREIEAAKKRVAAAEKRQKADPKDIGLQLNSTKAKIDLTGEESRLQTLIVDRQRVKRPIGGPVDFKVRWFEKKTKPNTWRANASDLETGGPRIELNFDNDTGTVVHEIGHMLEYDQLGKAANDFLNYRVGVEQPGRLADLFRGYGYRGNEYGRKDDFSKAYHKAGEANEHARHYAYYTGKDYSSAFYTRNGLEAGTEILSMGIEQLYRDPATFAEGDPEFFNFVLAALRGRL